jgi:imidazolonepropionase-like amidohydrolase
MSASCAPPSPWAVELNASMGDERPGLRGYRVDVAFDGERELPGGALVLLDGELITGVEPGSAPAPAGCEVTHVPDATLLPGLIDAHVHLCGDGSPRALDQLPELSQDDLDGIIDDALTRHLRAGVTTVRDLGDIGWAVVERRDTEPGRPRVVAAGPPITPVGGHCSNMGGGVAGSEALVQAVRERAERGVDVVKVMASGGVMTVGTDVLACSFTLDELRLVVEEAHGLGLPVTAHAHALAAVTQSVDAGVDGIEHCSCLTPDRPRIPPELLERLAAGPQVCPTLGRAPGVPTPPRALAIIERFGITAEVHGALAAQMHAAGVHLISGGDSGISPAKPHGGLAQSVIELATAGVPVSEALASATSRAAQGCGVAEHTGRLRPGLSADLLIVAGNALQDATALRSVRTVVARGRAVDVQEA